jgi:hypothetical protein
MPIQVSGLLLVNSQGQRYFIEGGIKADRLDTNLPMATGSEGEVVSFRPIAPATLKSLEDEQRETWFGDNNITEHPNLGPFLLQAYSIVLTRDDDGNDSEITGNGSTLEPLSTTPR